MMKLLCSELSLPNCALYIVLTWQKNQFIGWQELVYTALIHTSGSHYEAPFCRRIVGFKLQKFKSKNFIIFRLNSSLGFNFRKLSVGWPSNSRTSSWISGTLVWTVRFKIKSKRIIYKIAHNWQQLFSAFGFLAPFCGQTGLSASVSMAATEKKKKI